MSQKWTAGPWEAWDRGIGWEVNGPDGKAINSGFRDTFTKEDACLIAAAPELYESLSQFVESFGDPFKNARAALAKADNLYQKGKSYEPHS
jgi:hypothetical protein